MYKSISVSKTTFITEIHETFIYRASRGKEKWHVKYLNRIMNYISLYINPAFSRRMRAPVIRGAQ